MAQQNDRVLLPVTAAIYRNEKENVAMYWVLHGRGKAIGVWCIFRGVCKKNQFKGEPLGVPPRKFLFLGARKCLDLPTSGANSARSETVSAKRENEQV